MSKTAVIILAGGRGTRMQSDKSKQFIEVKGRPIIYYTLKRFEENKDIDKIILVLPEDEVAYCRENVLEKYELRVDTIVTGGAERQDSVYNGLKAAEGYDIVLIHDGARPFVSDRIIEEGVKYAEEYGAAAPGVMPKDTIKVKNDENFSVSTPDRSSLVAVQTPQCFKYDIIKDCHDKIRENHIKVTDDTMAIENYGNKVYLFDGEYTNLKITTPEDLVMAEYLADSL
ncbi:MAG: 2-C-methyl-D-erythritol 4-phosphate cytidylyltransferase [Inconstantimicrobium porci]|uniref:2-C-methyl-D-erythritol 4-phosphate cytidylyltransferase n=1 Tax=Inconstantimicrobium porci TaxID=2652291 RepID=A0A7X2T0T0_9CLOT|nr:2-C-methyl-D-erythritol 4-phosphate cytidylyltransferase [Inconstantimicrobium porci]MDD6769966.1 2-C-methyl-D-erythritol 4-phosphate cytidylyltransferase [Inconstantimicrobium porci]MDY5911736.1 2-C-methyl-D-erythritol 4-phosphate cytidylyltransferase [Inconstantimicrobium porci]MSR90480.1 2-C-methyl-D-erythritol 4-phosphate cytidylyltransferase [Inconstantimicrobium porci]